MGTCEHSLTKGTGSHRSSAVCSLAPPAAKEPIGSTTTKALMEKMLDRENLRRALRRVRSNKGAAGSDGMTAEELPTFLQRRVAADSARDSRQTLHSPTGSNRQDSPSQGGKQGACNSYSPGPHDSAGCLASHRSNLRAVLLGGKLWLSSQQECPSSS